MTRPNVQNLYPNVYLDIVKTLNLSDRITEYENELNKKIDRFLAADLSTKSAGGLTGTLTSRRLRNI